MGKNSPTHVAEGREGQTLVAINMKTRTVVGRREKGLLSDTGPELRLGREKEKEKHQRKGNTPVI